MIADWKRKARTVHRWIRNGFILWAIASTTWVIDSFRTRGVDEEVLQSTSSVVVASGETTLAFLPKVPIGASLVFLCGGAVAAEAYAPLLRPIAEAGYQVHIVRLPYRLAPLESHRQEAIERVRRVIAAHPDASGWVLSGHSLGAAIAARFALADARSLSAVVLIGTTHPKEDDLSFLRIPVTKVYATNDGVAPLEKTLANRKLLPSHTRWVEIPGGNHSQFGRYGHQLLDGSATLSRGQQEALTRAAIVEALARRQ